MKAESASTPHEEPIQLDVSHLVTEDETPVDNPFSEKQMRLLTEPLYASWNPGMPFVAMANVGLYFALNAPPFVPDTLVAVETEGPENLLPKEHRAYFTWLYGKVPDIVVEIVSNKVGEELTRKMTGYAHHGVPYYVVYDPEGHVQHPALQCFELSRAQRSGAYRPLERPYFPGAELGLVEWDGEYEGKSAPWIRWTDGSGVIIPTGAERAESERLRAEYEKRRAELEKSRAESEKKRAESEKSRADALAARLKELGVDPAGIGS